MAVADIDSYLNEFYVLDQALERRYEDFEETFNAAYFEEHGEPQTEEAQLDYARSYWVIAYGHALDHVEAVASVEAPSRFVEAHAAYVSTYRAMSKSIVSTVGGGVDERGV